MQDGSIFWQGQEPTRLRAETEVGTKTVPNIEHYANSGSYVTRSAGNCL